MRLVISLLCFIPIPGACGCSQHQTPAPSVPDRHETAAPGVPEPRESIPAWPKDWARHIGQTVTLEGTAANARLGALLQGEGDAIWIEGLDSWPEGFYSGSDQGKRLRVTGTVIRKDDLPVFVQAPGELPRTGIPVASEQERNKAKWRYLLSDAKWTVLD